MPHIPNKEAGKTVELNIHGASVFITIGDFNSLSKMREIQSYGFPAFVILLAIFWKVKPKRLI